MDNINHFDAFLNVFYIQLDKLNSDSIQTKKLERLMSFKPKYDNNNNNNNKNVTKREKPKSLNIIVPGENYDIYEDENFSYNEIYQQEDDDGNTYITENPILKEDQEQILGSFTNTNRNNINNNNNNNSERYNSNNNTTPRKILHNIPMSEHIGSFIRDPNVIESNVKQLMNE